MGGGGGGAVCGQSCLTKTVRHHPSTPAMDHKEPKTRTEKKGRDKQGGHGPYSAKHVRLQEARVAAAKKDDKKETGK